MFLKHELSGLGLAASERVLCVNGVGYCSQREQQGEGARSEWTATFRGNARADEESTTLFMARSAIRNI